MIAKEGLYDRGYLVSYSPGEIAIYRNPIFYNQSISDIYHVITDTDTLYSISRKYYGYSSLWFIIADVNDNIEDIFDLPIGETILIPSVSLIQSSYGGSK